MYGGKYLLERAMPLPQFDGQCQCKEGFGGRRCNQCQTYFYGDPRRHCMRKSEGSQL